jgi:thioredoxin-related protein
MAGVGKPGIISTPGFPSGGQRPAQARLRPRYDRGAAERPTLSASLPTLARRRSAPRRRLVVAAGLLVAAGGAFAQAAPSPHTIDIPRWFTNSLLDIHDEVKEAARHGKRVMLYIGQDGCPYCKALLKGHFGPGAIADKAQRHFVAIAINLWGDLDVNWIDGVTRSEKALARHLGVQFTPTLMFFDSDGRLLQRLDGYLAPERFALLMDYVIDRREREISLAEFMATRLPEPLAPAAAARPYLMRDPSQLSRAGRKRPLAVLFESEACKACTQLHAEALARAPTQALLKRFDVARLVPGTPAQLVTPDGRRVDARAWARDLKIQLYPTVVLFDAQGREAIRFDGDLRPFHVETAFDYVASGAHAREPQFQRYVQARADALRARGRVVDLWR